MVTRTVEGPKDQKDAPPKPQRLGIAAYNQWAVAEANRQLGKQMRYEEELQRVRRQSALAEVQEDLHRRAQATREQQDITAQAVARMHGQLVLKRQMVVAELQGHRERAVAQKEAWQSVGDRARQMELEQKRRIARSRADTCEAKGAAAVRARHDTLQRREEQRQAREEEMERRKVRLEELRKGSTSDSAINESRVFAAQQKKEAAAEVRAALQVATTDRTARAGEAIAQAHAGRSSALNSRKNAQSNRALVAARKQEEALAVRRKLRELAEERQQVEKEHASTAQGSRAARYESRFAPQGAVTQFHTSTFGVLLNHVRGVSAVDLAAAGFVPEKEADPKASDAANGTSPSATSPLGATRAASSSPTAVSPAADPSSATEGGAENAKQATAVPKKNKWQFNMLKHIKSVAASSKKDEGTAQGGENKESFVNVVKAAVAEAKKISVPGEKLGPNASHLAVSDAADACMAMKMVTAAELEAEAAAVENVASDASKGSAPVPLSVKVGEALLANKVKVDALIREWDPNNDGSVTKQEFRINMRKLFQKAPPRGEEVDALFKQLDSDGGGDLDVAELKAAFKKFKDTAHKARSSANAENAVADEKRAKAERIREVGRQVAKKEAMAAELLEMRKGGVGAKLGDIINLKNMKAADVARAWDKSGDGEIDMKEFRENVLSMGVKAEGEDIDALFKELDADGGGSLDMEEVRKALKVLQDASTKKKDDVRVFSRSFIATCKEAKKAIHDLRVEQDADKAKEKEAEQEKEKEAQEAAKLKEAAKMAAKEKRAAEEALKHEAAARLEAKRAAMKAKG